MHKVVTGARDDFYPGSLLLDYGLGKNGLDPARFLRDYLELHLELVDTIEREFEASDRGGAEQAAPAHP